MKVVLSTLNAKYIHSSLALRYIKAYGRTKGHTYDIAEYTINMPIYDILRQIDELECDVIGFCCYIWNIEMTIHLTRLLHSIRPDLIIILGGPEVSYCADEILENNRHLSFIIQGEGEIAFVELMEALEKGQKNPHIDGVRGIDEKGHLFGSRDVVEVPDLNVIPFPYSEEEMAALANKIVYYESSRGCPFSCQYCLSGNKNKVRFFDEARTIGELQWFMDHNVRQVKFVDRTFNCHKRHHLPIMKFILEAQTTTNFHLEMEGVLLSEEEVRILNEAPKGRFQIEVGVQSTNEQTLEAICRRNEWDHIVKMVKPIIDGGRTHVHLDLIIGLPYESYHIFKKSFTDLYNLQPQALQLGFLKLLKGSGVRKMAQFAYIHDALAPYEVLSNHVMDYKEVRFLKVFEDVFESFYNSEKYKKTFAYLYEVINKEKVNDERISFHIFEAMAKVWISCGYDKIKLNDLDRSRFLYESFDEIAHMIPLLEKYVPLLKDMVRIDTLVTFRGKIKDDSLCLPSYDKSLLRESEPFWKEEDLVKRYIPNYAFSEWRRIRKDYYEMVIHDETRDYLHVKSNRLVVDVTGKIAPFGRPIVEKE